MLVPDFQQTYGLRFVECVESYPAGEVLLLVEGLPADSRFAGRLQGDKGPGWSQHDWLLLDVRNTVEALRVMQIAKAKKHFDAKKEYRQWDQYPGAEWQRRRRTLSRFDHLRKLAARQG